MAIQELTVIHPPPKRSLDVREDHLKRNMSILGIELPGDYLELSRTYGTGSFCNGEIRLLNPYSQNFLISFMGLFKLVANQKHSGRIPYPIYPVSPGLLPMGSDCNGHSYFWMTKGKPDQWKIILKRHEDDFQERKPPLTTLLAKAFANKIRLNVWTNPFEKSELVFRQE